MRKTRRMLRQKRKTRLLIKYKMVEKKSKRKMTKKRH